jgi:hypothetical protein
VTREEQLLREFAELARVGWKARQRVKAAELAQQTFASPRTAVESWRAQLDLATTQIALYEWEERVVDAYGGTE